MEQERLKAQVESGGPIEAIAREVEKDASTVGYRVRKHGLRSSTPTSMPDTAGLGATCSSGW